MLDTRAHASYSHSMIPVAVQLWSVNDELKKDFAGTMKQVAKTGCKAVELVHTGNATAKEAQKVFADLGLSVLSWHVSWWAMTTPVEFDKIIEATSLYGVKELVISSMPQELIVSAKSCADYGETLGAMGVKIREMGLRLSYHHHDFDLVPFDGRPAQEWVLESSAPRDIASQVDVFWYHAAGIDPVRALTRIGARIHSLHLKDGFREGKRTTELGRGELDFPAIFAVSEKYNLAQWYVVEQEHFEGDPVESIRISLEYLKSLGKV